MAAPPPVVLVESMVEEILLRFPPDDPASLVRAALVCKPWCRLVAGRGFHRRFREFHRTPPVLGLLCNTMDKGHFEEDVVRFVPAASFPPTQRVRLNYRAIDARHGRVLLRCMLWDCDDLLNGEFVVWDPITHKDRSCHLCRGTRTDGARRCSVQLQRAAPAATWTAAAAPS